jgi:hypothetical protein
MLENARRTDGWTFLQTFKFTCPKDIAIYAANPNSRTPSKAGKA